ncbi:hypothetical protein [Pontibacter sp. SGAir0037]|nr:hypothetical protein [Pontibacter sp. SGAir0037]
MSNIIALENKLRRLRKLIYKHGAWSVGFSYIRAEEQKTIEQLKQLQSN